MKFENALYEDEFYNLLSKYKELGGNSINTTQLSSLIVHKKISPYAIVKKEKQFKDKMKKSNKEVAQKVMEYYKGKQ